jgi:hypothetical protein
VATSGTWESCCFPSPPSTRYGPSPLPYPHPQATPVLFTILAKPSIFTYIRDPLSTLPTFLHHISRSFRLSLNTLQIAQSLSFDTSTTAHTAATMAAAQPARPIYHDPSTPNQTRTRRSSSRMSFASLPRSASHLDSPRAPCPKDGDAFSFDPAHLHVWYLPQTLWDHLPAELQSRLTAVQHSGAAVLTGKLQSPLYHVLYLPAVTLHRVLTCRIHGPHLGSWLTQPRICPPRQAH